MGERTHVVATLENCGTGLTFVWSADNGAVDPAERTSQSSVVYTAPDFAGPDTIHVEVRNSDGKVFPGQVTVTVVTATPTPTFTPTIPPP
ncbi:MAG: hypothetical protein AB1791_17355, partial [Chloroflexota bacterium]